LVQEDWKVANVMLVFKMILRSGKLWANKQEKPSRQANKYYSKELN